MSILIKEMEMPTCFSCQLESYCCRWAKHDVEWQKVNRDDDCPLIEVPPHGRLIEKNDVFELIQSFPNVDRHLPVEFMKALYDIPTIIEAEDGSFF